MLEAKGVNSAYGRARILYDLGLSAERGEVVVLLGRNGAGKSTTLKTLIGLVRPLSGEISFDGRRIEQLEPYQIARLGLGYVPEERRIFTDLSVTENLEVGRQAARAGAPQWTPERLFQLFPNLAGMRERPGAHMSGGEQQMLTIARTLMGNPSAILLDEPSEGLAPVMVQQLEGIITQLKQTGLAVLLVEQNLYSALAVADEVYILETGAIVHHCAAAELENDKDTMHRFLGV
jgi:branched-chain amino acid transport system ATP-binding protein